MLLKVSINCTLSMGQCSIFLQKGFGHTVINNASQYAKI